MDEVPSNQDNSELSPFLGSAMFANHGEQSAGNSSPETGWVPIIARRPSNSQHDIALVGSNRLGVGILENDNLFDDESLTSTFENMSLSFMAGAADSAVISGSVRCRDGRCPAGLMISSADNTRNGSLQPAFAQDDFVPSSLMINNAEHMEPRFGGQNPPVDTRMHGADNAYVNAINLLSALPLQQQCFIDGWSQTYAPQQMDSKFRWRDSDLERHSLMQSQYSYQQMPQVAGSDVRWINSNQCGVVNSSPKSAASPHLRTPTVHHLGHGSADIYWNGAMVPNGNNLLNSTRANNCPCIIYPDCSCETCEHCQIQLSEKLKHPYGLRRSTKGLLQNHILDEVKPRSSPEKILMKSEGVNSIRNIKPGFALDGCAETNQRLDHNHHLNIQSKDSLHFDLQSSQCLSSLGSELAMKSAQLKYNSVDEVIGELYLLAKDQNGCRFLQRIFTEGSQEDAQKVFGSVIEHIDELMVDPFGNYLVQKLLEECNDDQKMHIVYEITKRQGQLIKVSCNMHGTRVVQKVIETINTSDEFSMVVSALSPGAITLMMDANGSHVAHCCLQKMSPEYNAFLLNAAIEYCFELAKDRQGCCIIQKCILHANMEQKNRLLYSITSRALDLAEDQYGNYVIQYILELKVTWATDKILDKLEGHYGYLSMQKCSSNVVEKCLKEAREPKRVKIIHELINDPKLPHILLDQYGNYVIQTTLRVCEDATVHAALIGAIKPHAAALRNNMFGKRVLSKTCLKNTKY
ncbi:pumilio homolog 12-like [Phragmites australis]|uniref:pumilio homolog 12-like n=1 Tax=Phragmites australis TaxID=29695 RepID=UPI002D79E85C|nr:pumilio homolog 12-like [Phragmites australis]XP_062204343.1 pumilio homolog 12-like [Phragmites australis]